jgi:hypothetical protein
MIFVVALLYLKTKWFRGVMFVISLAYTVYHVFHVLGEFKKPKLDLAQIPLLSLVLIFSLLLNKESWKYFKYEK